MFRVLRRHMKVFRRIWWTNTMFNFLEPILYMTAMGFGLGAYVQNIDGISYAQFIAPGFIASSGMWASTFECTYGSFVRLQFEKTLHSMLAAPLTVADVVWGEILYATVKSFFYGTVILAAIALLGLVQSWWSILILPFLALPGMVFALLALSFTGFIKNIDHINYYITIFSTPVYLFSGIFFPLDSLPLLGQAAVWINPLYHSVEVCRALVLGHVSPALLSHVAVLISWVIVLGWLPVKLMRNRLLS
ncbi:ABC transporter permease [Anaerospora hongkongensis]|uniref:ABC transporter permease n=1 Tax=Anaerospora hongkongensis TaxID=244830 RepID=UPI0028987952|nr:ABC transporter permease [Anaerospora hongkongensis]